MTDIQQDVVRAMLEASQVNGIKLESLQAIYDGGEVTDNGAHGSDDTAQKDFKYDYDKGALAVSRFSDTAILDRVVQRYGAELIRTGKLIYGFDEVSREWVSNKQDPSTIDSMIRQVLEDCLTDERFIPELCLDRQNNFNDEKYKKAKEKLLGHRVFSNALQGIETSRKIKRGSISIFDSNPGHILCANGILDMQSLELRSPVAGDYLLHNNGVTWDENAEYGWFLDFLGEVFSENSDTVQMVNVIGEIFGYSLSGSVDEQKVFIHYGMGSNGKSKVLDALQLISGKYATRMGGTSLSKTKNAVQKELDRHGAKIEGKRTVIIDDLDSKTQWNEGLIKNFTSDIIPARRLYEEERDIPNRAKFHIGCNEVPTPETENYGILRRLFIIPYLRKFPPNSVIEERIKHSFKTGKAGILRWAVENYHKLKTEDRGIGANEEISLSLEDYREENFKQQGSLIAFFGEPGKEWLGEQLEWVEIGELVERCSLGGVMISKVALGRELSGTFGFKCQRERKEGCRVNRYLVPKL